MKNSVIGLSEIFLLKLFIMGFFLCCIALPVHAGRRGYSDTSGLSFGVSRDFAGSFSIAGDPFFGPSYYDSSGDADSGCISSGCADSSSSSGGSNRNNTSSASDGDGELVAEIFFFYVLFPSVTARAIAAQEQHEELQGDVKGSVIKNQSRNWTLFGFSATSTLAIYISLITVGVLNPAVGVISFGIYSGTYFIHFLVSASLFGNSQAYWSGYNTYYNRTTTYYFITSSASLGVSLATMFLFLGILLYERYHDTKKRKFDEGYGYYNVKVDFAPEILGIKIRFGPRFIKELRERRRLLHNCNAGIRG